MASITLRGETVPLLSFAKNGEIAVRAPSPAPPGARLDAAALADDGAESAFRIKVHRCKREEQGTFVLVGATIDLRREARETLEMLVQSAPGIPRGF